MDRVLVLLLAALAMFNTGTAEPQDDSRTVGDIFLERYNITIKDRTYQHFKGFVLELALKFNSTFVPAVGDVLPLPLVKEITNYVRHVEYWIFLAFAHDLNGTPLQSIYKDLNHHCAGSIVDLTVEPSNMTCVSIRLRKLLKAMLRRDIGVGLQKVSDLCGQQIVPLCDKGPTHCTTAYEGKLAEILSNYVEDAQQLGAVFARTPVEYINIFIFESFIWVMTPYISAYSFLTSLAYYVSTFPSSLEPFTLENIILFRNKQTEPAFFSNETGTRSTDESTWGIVKTRAGRVTLPCSEYRDIYERESQQYLKLLQDCYLLNVTNLSYDLLRCLYSNGTSRPLTLSTVPSAYFHSPCLCLAYGDSDCGVKAPRGVDPPIYCLSVLFRDFQRQASYRPAITYLDYSFQTRIPVCQFSNIIQLKFYDLCSKLVEVDTITSALSVQCYFKDLVNKELNCSESLIVNTYNETLLCGLVFFMDHVDCNGVDDFEVPVPYYRAGDSPLVLFLTYGDVVVRVLTIVTYLACKQLRNLPGKLLVAYLATALLRLVVVQATLADMAMAVRLDVALDLSTTLWLTCYLHFLTVSIRDLRPPDSLSREEARMVLLRYSLLGWVFPAVLSIAFFSMDEFIDSHVQFGHLLFVLCNYVALFANLYMCYVNCSFYLDVKKSARKLKQGSRKRDVFAAIFNFAIKTSVLSGAGITIRLAFTQIQGLEQLLSYYHVMGSLQGLLVFLLYGCNHEARAFWLHVVRSIILRFRRPQNVPV